MSDNGRVPTTSSEAAIEIEDLVVDFGDLRAVNNISLTVNQGEIFGLLGPNGAGKTTTLRVLVTLLRPQSGHARVAGYDVRRDSLRVRASIGYIPQALSADAALTAQENLDFYAQVTGVPRRERRQRIEEAVEAMGIESFRRRLARDLSGGMLRRLEIATALLNRPPVLFLDEPTVGLDPTARRVVWERLDVLREQAETTILVTTHIMEEAERNCERIAIMDRGSIVAIGTPTELIEKSGVGSVEDVFTAVTGHDIEEGGGIKDVRQQRRLAQRLG